MPKDLEITPLAPPSKWSKDLITQFNGLSVIAAHSLALPPSVFGNAVSNVKPQEKWTKKKPMTTRPPLTPEVTVPSTSRQHLDRFFLSVESELTELAYGVNRSFQPELSIQDIVDVFVPKDLHDLLRRAFTHVRCDRFGSFNWDLPQCGLGYPYEVRFNFNVNAPIAKPMVIGTHVADWHHPAHARMLEWVEWRIEVGTRWAKAIKAWKNIYDLCVNDGEHEEDMGDWTRMVPNKQLGNVCTLHYYCPWAISLFERAHPSPSTYYDLKKAVRNGKPPARGLDMPRELLFELREAKGTVAGGLIMPAMPERTRDVTLSMSPKDISFGEVVEVVFI